MYQFFFQFHFPLIFKDQIVQSLEFILCWNFFSIKQFPIKLVFPNQKNLPILLNEHEWIILRAFIVQRNSDSQADSVLRTSSFVVPTDYLPYLEEDAKQNLIPLADISHISEFRSGIVSVECYRDPCEISWADWIDEEENIIKHATLDSQGNPIRIDLRALTCQFHWNDVNEEQEQWFPSKELREMLGIVDFRGGQFLTNTGSVQALALDRYGQKWDFPSCNILLAKRDSIFELLQQQNLTIGWGMWLFREAAYPLNVDSGKERVFRNWKNITFWTGSQFKVIPQEDVTEFW